MSDKNKKGTESKTYKFDTLSLHAGYQPHKNAGSRQVPIYQTTSYLFDDVDHAAALFNLEWTNRLKIKPITIPQTMVKAGGANNSILL